MSRIALALIHPRNEELLSELLSDFDIVHVTDTVPNDTGLCIVDEQGLERSLKALAKWKDSHQLYHPVLLLTESTGGDPWNRHGHLLDEALDAIQTIPAPKQVLRSRVESLIARHYDSKELAQERELNKRIFETSPIAKTVLDTEGTIVRANERAEEILGLTASEIAGRTYDAPEWQSFDLNGDPIPSDELPFARVMETGTPVYDYVHGIERPTGERVWLSINTAPLYDEEGEIEYLVAAIDDITERLTQKQELERLLDLFEKAQDIAQVGAWEYDLQQDRGYWTDEVAQIHGLSSTIDPNPELSIQYYHPDDQPTIAAAFERAVEHGESYDLELRLIDEDGDLRWVRTRGEPQYEDGRRVRIRGTIQDISDRKIRELELERMTHAVDEAPIGITLTDPSQEDNPIIYVNEGFVELTGYSREVALGRNCRFLQGANTDEETVATIRQAIESTESVSVEIRNYRADGAEFWNHLRIAPVLDTDGSVRNYIGFQQDVTDRVERQRELAKLDRFLRHNVRNNVTLVKGMAGLIQQEGEPPVTGYAQTIERAAMKLIRNAENQKQITEVLQNEPVIRSIDLTQILESVIAKLHDQYPAAQISLSSPDSVTVQGTTQLDMAFTELLQNALDHNDNPTPTTRIDVSVANGMVTVSIVDNGPGMPEMEVDILTEGEEETEIYHSQGLGLWLVHLIVRRSGGKITIQTDASKGTEVSITIPQASSE